jgi:hypothetical protein
MCGRGRASRDAVAGAPQNDGTITRFGWKAQNKSLLVFAGEVQATLFDWGSMTA